MVDDYLATIPDLSKWLASPNINQIVLGNKSSSPIISPTPPNHTTANIDKREGSIERDVVTYQQDKVHLEQCLKATFVGRDNKNINQIICPNCQSENIIKWGKGRSKCKDCNRTFKTQFDC